MTVASRYRRGPAGQFTRSPLGARNHDDAVGRLGLVGSGRAFLLSGQFSTTVVDSLILSGPYGISFTTADSAFTVNAGINRWLLLYSGKFTSTLKTSTELNGVISLPLRGLSVDADDYYLAVPKPGGPTTHDIFYGSGHFSTTIRDSEAAEYATSAPAVSVCWDGTDTLWVNAETGSIATVRLVLQSGRFSSSIKTSQDIRSTRKFPRGVSWDGVNTIWQGNSSEPKPYKLFLQSGKFTSTIKTSLLIPSILGNHIAGAPRDLEHSIMNERLT